MMKVVLWFAVLVLVALKAKHGSEHFAAEQVRLVAFDLFQIVITISTAVFIHVQLRRRAAPARTVGDERR